uniref:GPN-loop GTPase 2-like n=1 Tax=Myxine glutinosa TaxID=7769 RepID=UPI00358F279B
MESMSLGPNGGLLYCMDYLESNLDWLHNQLVPLRSDYLLFDCPGQVELYTHHGALKSVFESLTKKNIRLAAVHLVDSHYCSDPGKFVSVLCTTLCTMLHVELPHINILSKVDLIEQYGRLAFNLDYYTEVMDLSYLLDHLANDPFLAKYKKLNEELVSLIESYGLVSFLPLNVQDKESMHDVMKTVDKANGYCFGNEEERNLQALMSISFGDTFHMDRVLATQEKYIKGDAKTVEEELRDS